MHLHCTVEVEKISICQPARNCIAESNSHMVSHQTSSQTTTKVCDSLPVLMVATCISTDSGSWLETMLINIGTES